MTANPTAVARNLPKHKGKVGDRIVYRDMTTALLTEMTVEGVVAAADGAGVVYLGAGNRAIHSRLVREVK